MASEDFMPWRVDDAKSPPADKWPWKHEQTGAIMYKVGANTWEATLPTDLIGKPSMTIRWHRDDEAPTYTQYSVTCGTLTVRPHFWYDQDEKAWGDLLAEVYSWSERLHKQLVHAEYLAKMPPERKATITDDDEEGNF